MPTDRPPPLPSWTSKQAAEPEDWDQDEADWLVGQYALVGITWVAADGETVKTQGQYHGRIVAADKSDGFKIECEGACAGQTMSLPPDTNVFSPADPGEYKLRSTGEVVKDPDVLASWTIIEPVRS
jgi:hypothetical protein